MALKVVVYLNERRDRDLLYPIINKMKIYIINIIQVFYKVDYFINKLVFELKTMLYNFNK